MSLLFGKVCQNGHVVRDMEAALRFWTQTLRVGPFFYIEKVRTDWFRHRGRESPVGRFFEHIRKAASRAEELRSARNGRGAVIARSAKRDAAIHPRSYAIVRGWIAASLRQKSPSAISPALLAMTAFGR